ncbi:MAG: siroheme synthase CysG [Terracidiphilus sp.]|jgi:uroporphyrin-III C-methyltransferase/precorrin-2 dehydrogenase/sirohydrochlorin ferrochelatase
MSLLPIFLKLDGRRCLLVGAGTVALDKISSLLKTGLRLRVIAPEAKAEVRQLATDGRLEWIQRPFELSDLDGNFLVIAATDSDEVNAQVYRGAVKRGILTNSVDDPPNCDFFFGSTVSRGSLQVAISTAGESPAFAQQLRREIDEQLPEEIGSWLENLGKLRREVLATHPPGEARRLLLHQLAQRSICESEDCPARQLAFAPVDEVEAGPDVDDDSSETCAPQAEEGPATVRLVGAGPGDPDLLTVKALHLIQTADVILHDDLVPRAILDHASPSAEIVNVGKRCGHKGISQDEINALMIEHARARHEVVRLKGGDPLVFGRAAEEMAALTEAGIPFEIVPGITAAFAAAAALGCSLTVRNRASNLIFSAGHRAPSQSDGNSSLPRIEDATRVVYMPGRDQRLLAQQWLEEGLPPDLPCAIVSRAAQPDQQIQSTTLAALGDTEPTLAPSILIAGWVLREANVPIHLAGDTVPVSA